MSKRKLYDVSSSFEDFELKYFDSYLSGGTIQSGTTWANTELDPATLLTLFCPTVGDGVDKRNGQKVLLLRLQLRGTLHVQPASNWPVLPEATDVRLILYNDTQTNSTQTQGEEVMKNPGAATAALAMETFPILDGLNRFEVLHDEKFEFNGYPASFDGTANQIDTGGVSAFVDINLCFDEPLLVLFNASSNGTITDLCGNSLHLIGTTNSSQQEVVLNYQCRGVYIDL